MVHHPTKQGSKTMIQTSVGNGPVGMVRAKVELAISLEWNAAVTGKLDADMVYTDAQTSMARREAKKA